MLSVYGVGLAVGRATNLGDAAPVCCEAWSPRRQYGHMRPSHLVARLSSNTT